MDWTRLLGGLAVLGIALGVLGGLSRLAVDTATATAFSPTAALVAVVVGWGVVLLVALAGASGAATKTTTYW